MFVLASVPNLQFLEFLQFSFFACGFALYWKNWLRSWLYNLMALMVACLSSYSQESFNLNKAIRDIGVLLMTMIDLDIYCPLRGGASALPLKVIFPFMLMSMRESEDDCKKWLCNLYCVLENSRHFFSNFHLLVSSCFFSLMLQRIVNLKS